jgi:hypothetical protein
MVLVKELGKSYRQWNLPTDLQNLNSMAVNSYY